MIIKEQLSTAVTYECDVLVTGGGVAGIAAALAAARSGKSVILTERVFLLGGLATSGLIAIYLPLCDGYGRQVSFGLAEELLRLSVKHWHDDERGYGNWIAAPQKSGENDPRFEVNFNPQLFAIAVEELLLREGVRILYGTTAVAAHTEKDRLCAVIFENKSGRFAIAAHSFVDATGDADLALFTGVPTVTHGTGNVLAAWYYSNAGGGYDLRMLGCADVPDPAERAKHEKLSALRFSGLDGEEISHMVTLSHKQILADLARRREKEPLLQPTTVATIPQLRMTRRIDGAYTQNENECHKHFPDSIGMISDWRKRGPVYEIPFRTLYSPCVKNLLFAGRITSVTDEMWDISRVIPPCAVTGEAAGIAASLFDDMTTADISRLKEELSRRGVRLHESDLHI